MILKELVLELIPDSLKSSSLFNDVLSILVEYLEENSKETLDILNVYNEDSNAYPEIINTYAHNFMDIIKRAKDNVYLQDKLVAVHKKFGIDYDVTKLNINPNKILNRDNLELLKNFYQTKGTLKSFRYVYDIFNKLQLEDSALQSESVFDVSESSEMLTYDLKTNMMMELYEQFVKPMIHPLGWAYIYSRLVQTSFKDYMFVSEVYNILHFTIDNTRDKSLTDDFKLNRGHLFETLEDGSARLINGLPNTYPAINETTYQVFRLGKYYNELSLESEICLVQDPNVIKVETGENGQTGDNWIRIDFASGEYIEQHSIDPELGIRTLRLYYGTGPNALNQTIKKDYTPFIGEYGLDIQYTTEFKTQTLENLTLEMTHGFFDTCGAMLFCGAGNAIASNANICGSKRLGNVTDSNALTRIKSISLNPKYQNTRQSFLGFKYKYPSVFLYINLENYAPEEFPLTLTLEGSNFTIDYTGQKKTIIQADGIYLNQRYTLDYGYTDKEYTCSIYSKDNLIEECKFRLVPNIEATKKQVELVDFNFDYNPDLERTIGAGYSREATMQYFTDFAPPPHIDAYADTWELTWEHIEYYYYANIGSLSQLPVSNFIKEVDVYDYLYPKYFSNMVGHFKLYDYQVSYDASKGRLVGCYPSGSICSDFEFSIVSIKV